MKWEEERGKEGKGGWREGRRPPSGEAGVEGTASGGFFGPTKLRRPLPSVPPLGPHPPIRAALAPGSVIFVAATVAVVGDGAFPVAVVAVVALKAAAVGR